MTATLTSTDGAMAAMNAIRRVVRALRQAERTSEAGQGVSAAQLFVLRELSKADSLTIGALAERTATAQSSVSEVVSRLVARGLAVRGTAAEDRRRAAIALTPAGRTLLTTAPETVQERMLAGFAALQPEEQDQLSATLTEWIRRSGLDQVEATMFFEPVAKAG